MKLTLRLSTLGLSSFAPLRCRQPRVLTTRPNSSPQHTAQRTRLRHTSEERDALLAATVGVAKSGDGDCLGSGVDLFGHALEGTIDESDRHLLRCFGCVETSLPTTLVEVREFVHMALNSAHCSPLGPGRHLRRTS